MDRLGVVYEAASHRCDEEGLKSEGLGPREIAEKLACEKAESLRGACPGAWILGSDQVLEVDGDILNKPGDAAGAVAQLKRLRGRTHRLITAVALVGPEGQRVLDTNIHTLRMRALDDAALERYVAADEPLDCCGSYRIESRGIALFEAIEGTDYTAIVGLPMIAVVSMLREAGFEVP